MTDWYSTPKERQTNCFQSFCHSFGVIFLLTVHEDDASACFRPLSSTLIGLIASRYSFIEPMLSYDRWGLCFLSSSIAFSALLWQGTRVRGRRRVPLILPSYPHWGLFYHGKQSSRYTLPLWDARNPPR